MIPQSHLIIRPSRCDTGRLWPTSPHLHQRVRGRGEGRSSLVKAKRQLWKQYGGKFKFPLLMTRVIECWEHGRPQRNVAHEINEIKCFKHYFPFFKVKFPWVFFFFSFFSRQEKMHLREKVTCILIHMCDYIFF